jgi:hypothetical protein
MAKKSKQLTEVEEVTMYIEKAEKLMADHKAKGVTSWEQFSEDELDELHQLILGPLDFRYRKGYQHNPVLVAQKKRHDAIMEWNASLGGFDE